MNNEANTEQVIVSKEQVESICSYLKTIPKVNVIPSDDLMGATKGFISFHQDSADAEQNLWLSWQFSKPILEKNRLFLGSIDEGEIEKCLLDGWIKCDNPKERLLGFAKYAPLESEEESRAVFISITFFKEEASKELQEKVIKWREK